MGNLRVEEKDVKEGKKIEALKPLYSLAPGINPDAFNNIVIDKKSLELWNKGDNGQRYAVVGWVVGSELHLRFRPGFESESSSEVIAQAKEKFGDNIVISEKDRIGVVHEETVRQVMSEEPQLILDSRKARDGSPLSHFGKQQQQSVMVGLSVFKDLGKKCRWLNRSSQNLPTFLRDPLAIACNTFNGKKEVYTLEYHLNRSIPREFFIPMIEKATEQLVGPEFKLDYSDCYSFKSEDSWAQVRAIASDEERQRIIKEKLLATIQIAVVEGDFKGTKSFNLAATLNKVFRAAAAHHIKFDSPSWVVTLQQWMESGQLQKWLESDLSLQEIAVLIAKESDFDSLKILAKMFKGEQWNKKYEEGVQKGFANFENNLEVMCFLILANKSVPVSAIVMSIQSGMNIDIMQPIRESSNVFHLAADEGDSAALEIFYGELERASFFQKEALLNGLDREGRTPVQLAAAKGHFEILKRLDQWGVNLDESKIMPLVSPPKLAEAKDFFLAIKRRDEMLAMLLPIYKSEDGKVLKEIEREIHRSFKENSSSSFLNLPLVHYVAKNKKGFKVLKQLEQQGIFLDEAKIMPLISGDESVQNTRDVFNAIKKRDAIFLQLDNFKDRYDVEVIDGLKKEVRDAYNKGSSLDFLNFSIPDISSLAKLFQLIKDIKDFRGKIEGEPLNDGQRKAVVSLETLATEISESYKKEEVSPEVLINIIRAELMSQNILFASRKKSGLTFFPAVNLAINEIQRILIRSEEKKSEPGLNGPPSFRM